MESEERVLKSKYNPYSFIEFFKVLKDNFWNIISLNLIFVFFNLPAIIISLVIFLFFFKPGVFVSENLDLIARIIFALFFSCIPFITVGPSQAGLTYVLKNIASSNPGWIWNDFKENAISNLKESFIISSIDLLVAMFLAFDITILKTLFDDKNDIVPIISLIAISIFLIIYSIMHMYIYAILVSVNLSIKHIFKNALIFSFITPIKNILTLVLCFIIIACTFLLVKPIFAFVIYLTFTASFVNLVIIFNTYPNIKRYLIDKSV